MGASSISLLHRVSPLEESMTHFFAWFHAFSWPFASLPISMSASGLGWKSQKGRNNAMAYHVLPSKFAGRSALLKRPHILTRPKMLLAANNPRWIIRYAYYAFIFSIPFESAAIGIVPEHLTIARMIGYVFVLVALLQPSRCFRSPPKAFWYFVAYLYVFVALGFVQESE